MAAVAEVSIREVFGKTLVDVGRANPNVVVLDSDLSHSTMSRYFAQEFPDRFFNVGIAEQNMMGIAAGLAASGKIVFACTFAVFAVGRCFDQLRISIAQPGLNVKVLGSHGGITVGEDGVSHQSVEDLSLVSTLPGFTVVVPADGNEMGQVTRVAARTPGPFYIRSTRPKRPVIFDSNYVFKLGKAARLREGRNATIIANGVMVAPALDAAGLLAAENLECRVLAMPTLKPIDTEAIVAASRETGAIVTAEEHLEHGGLGSRVAQATAGNCPVPMAFVAVKDTFCESGKAEDLVVKYGLTAQDICKAVRNVVSRKR